jgi:hypothetical protein
MKVSAEGSQVVGRSVAPANPVMSVLMDVRNIDAVCVSLRAHRTGIVSPVPISSDIPFVMVINTLRDDSIRLEVRFRVSSMMGSKIGDLSAVLEAIQRVTYPHPETEA